MLRAERAQIYPDLEIIFDAVVDRDLLRDGISGHQPLEIRKQIGRGIFAAGDKNKLLCVSVISDVSVRCGIDGK